MKIFIGKGGAQEGPYTEEEVLARRADGRLADNDLAWTSGMSGWVRLVDFLKEKGLVAEAPPLPGAAVARVAPTESSAQGRDASHAEIATQARARMEGRYWEAFGAMFIANMLSGLSQMVPFIGGVLRLFIEPVFNLGVLTYMMRRARPEGPAPEVSNIFAAFKFYGRSLGLFWYMVLRILLWVAPGVVVLGAGLFFIDSDSTRPLGVALAVAGALATAVAGILCGYRYALHFYLGLDHPDKPVAVCLSDSVRLMDGHKWRLFALHLCIIWKPLLAIFGVVGAAVMLAFAASEAGRESPLFYALLGAVVLLGLLSIPLIYFYIRANLRAAVARAIFYDERAWLASRVVAPAIVTR